MIGNMVKLLPLPFSLPLGPQTPTVLSARPFAVDVGDGADRPAPEQIRALQTELARLSRASSAPESAPASVPSSESLTHLSDELQALDQRLRVFQRNIESTASNRTHARGSGATNHRRARGLCPAVRRRQLPASPARLRSLRRPLLSRRQRAADARHVHPPPCPANLRHHDVQTVRCQGHA